MEYNLLLGALRGHYPEMGWMSDEEFLLEVESKLIELSRMDDLTPEELELVRLLPDVREYLC
jgi:hypothetical protein